MKAIIISIFFTVSLILTVVGISINIKLQELEQRLTELEQLEHKKDIEEYRWRKELINDIKN